MVSESCIQVFQAFCEHLSEGAFLALGVTS